MKKIVQLVLSALLTLPLISSEDHHSHAKLVGPQGGKVLESTPLHAEFFVQPDQKISVTFYDDSMKKVPPSMQSVKVIIESKSEKKTIELEKAALAFVSKEPITSGDGYRVVVQIKNDPAAKPQNFRIDYITALCGGCKRAEYACTCEHAEGGNHSGHKH